MKFYYVRFASEAEWDAVPVEAASAVAAALRFARTRYDTELEQFDLVVAEDDTGRAARSIVVDVDLNPAYYAHDGGPV